jgi:tRNA(Ile)-lysidine synthase
VHSLAERLLSHIRREELLKAGDRVGVAVSGGIDSVALLRVLLELRGELGIVLSVVHFNHKLRGAESEADQEFVASLAREHDLEFHCDGDDVARHAAEEHVSVEAAARELRYGFFGHLLAGAGDRSGAKAPVAIPSGNRSAESAAPPKSSTGSGDPQGLKPDSLGASTGTAKAVPFHEPYDGAESQGLKPDSSDSPLRSPEGPPFQGAALDKICTGHTLDDQAETVLMRLIRGAGMRGLGGIYPRLAVEDDDGEICGEILRPLLSVRRRELEQYLKDIGQTWREDSTNDSTKFTRNRVRKLVVPLLEKEFNPSVAESLAELAEIARGEEDYWENEVAGWMGTAVHWSEPDWARALSNSTELVQISTLGNMTGNQHPHPVAQTATRMGHPNDLQSRIDDAPWLVTNATVSRIWFLGEPAAVQRRLVKAIGERAGIPLEFKHVEEILRFAAESGGSGKELSLPLGWKLVREPEELIFLTPDLREPSLEQDYEYELCVPGRATVNEIGSAIEAQRTPAGADAGYNSEHLLDPDSLPGPLRVRNWRPGDRFWPAHTKSPKKIKELLQELHVGQPERRLWPVLVSGGEIVWMRGFPVPAKFRATPEHEAIVILENSLAE